MTTLITLDTEFTDFINCELVSIGLIHEDGELEFYAEVREAFDSPHWSAFAWNVVHPLLTGHDSAAPTAELGKQLYEWLRLMPRPILILTDEPGYDWMLLKEALGPHIKHLMIQPYRFDSMCLGIEHRKTLSDARMNYFGDERPEHHALHDARALKEMLVKAKNLGWVPM